MMDPLNDREDLGENIEHESSAVYFASLVVEDFRCFGPRQVLNLSDGQGRPARWTVILGDNGVGKTTLLECLIGRYQKSNKVIIQYYLGNFSSGTLFYNVKGGSWANSFVYWASRRLEEPEEFEMFSEMNLDSDQRYLINAVEWLLQVDSAASKPSPIQEQAKERLDLVRSTLIALLPDVEEIRFAEPWEDGEELWENRVEFKTPYGWVPLNRLSLGYKTLLAWMVDLAARMFTLYPNSQNPIAEPAVVLVDEIDLHLHPRWQRTIIDFLSERFLNTQFIVTSHSPLIVQSAHNANIVVLRREGDHVVIDNTPKSVFGWRVDQILTSDLFGLESARPKLLDELLKQREAILSQGTLTTENKEKLRLLEEQIGFLPTGESVHDREAMDLIHRVAARLKAEEATRA